MKKLLIPVVLGYAFSVAASTDALDGLTAWWKFNGTDTNGNGAADVSETVDLTTLGRAGGARTAKAMTRNPDTGAVVTFETVVTETPYHGQGAAEFEDTFLFFPQPYDADENTLAKTTARLDGALRTSGTIHLKFKWSGGFTPTVAPTYCLLANAYEWSNSQGYALYVFGKSDDVSAGTLVIRLGQDPQTSLCDIKANVWYDLVLRVELKPDSKQTAVDAYLADKANVFGFNGITHVQRTLDRTADFSVSTWVGNDITLASETPEDGSSQAFSAATAKCFRGYVGDLQIFERLLSEVEIYSLMARSYGSTWAVGAVNGSADEFAGALGSVAGVGVDDWKDVVHGLSGPNEVLTVAATLDENDVGRAKMLALYPLVTGVSGASVEVSVNGAVVKRTALRSDCKVILLDGSVVRNGEDGKMTVSLRRVDKAGGTLSFDAIRLCGSWQIGASDEYASSDEFSNCGRVGPNYFSGDAVAKHCTRGTEGMYQFKDYNYTFSVPNTDKVKMTFEALVCNVRLQDAEVTEPIGIEVRYNGTLLSTYSPLKRLDAISVELPADKRVPGLNTVTLTMVNQSDNNSQVYFDYFRLVQEALPKPGLMIFFR